MTLFEGFLILYISISFIYLLLTSLYRVERWNSWRDLELWEVLLILVFLPIVVCSIVLIALIIAITSSCERISNGLKLTRNLGDIFKRKE